MHATKKIIAALPVTSGSINLIVNQLVPNTIKLAINEIWSKANRKRKGFIWSGIRPVISAAGESSPVAQSIIMLVIPKRKILRPSRIIIRSREGSAMVEKSINVVTKPINNDDECLANGWVSKRLNNVGESLFKRRCFDFFLINISRPVAKIPPTISSQSRPIVDKPELRLRY